MLKHIPAHRWTTTSNQAIARIRTSFFSIAFAGAFVFGAATLGADAPRDTAQDEDVVAAKPWVRPKHKFSRHDEDWSVLRGKPADATDDLWDPIKYIPLNEDGSIWGSFGGHARLRFEGWNRFAFGAPAQDNDEFLLVRLLLHTDLHFGENIRVFAEGKSALSTDRDLPGGRRTLDVDALDLQQGFVDVRFDLTGDATLTLRAGRQALLFGKQRLVSPLAWSNTLRSWDGFTGIFKAGKWNVTGFWTQFASIEKYSFNDSDAGNEFFGVYAVGHVPGTEIGLDLYWLGLDRDSASFNGTVGDEKRHTLGGRLFGTVGENFDYDLEGAYQFGEVGSGDVSAFMVATQTGWTFGEVWGSPRLHLGFDYASGDESPGGDVETFNQLFPLGHAYLGYIDIVGRQNVIDINPGLTIKPAPGLTVGINGHLFYRAEDSDAFYNAGGGVVRSGAAGGANEIGAEIDFTVKYLIDTHTTVLAGFSHFFAGDFIEESGASEDIDFVYFQLQYTF